MIAQSFLVADAVTFGPDGKAFIHGGGIGKIFATDFPWTQPQLAVYVTLVPEEGDEPGPDHDLTVTFIAPGGEELDARISGTFRIPPTERESLRPRITFASQFVGAQFPGPGVYWVRVVYDSNELARLPLEVEERRQGEWIPVQGPSVVG